jgi:hypothetical protein
MLKECSATVIPTQSAAKGRDLKGSPGKIFYGEPLRFLGCFAP